MKIEDVKNCYAKKRILITGGAGCIGSNLTVILLGGRVDELIDGLHACKRADRKQPVLVAGDPERAAFLERSKSGIPLSRSLFEDIRSIALASNIPFYLDQGP